MQLFGHFASLLAFDGEESKQNQNPLVPEAPAASPEVASPMVDTLAPVGAFAFGAVVRDILSGHQGEVVQGPAGNFGDIVFVKFGDQTNPVRQDQLELVTPPIEPLMPEAPVAEPQPEAEDKEKKESKGEKKEKKEKEEEPVKASLEMVANEGEQPAKNDSAFTEVTGDEPIKVIDLNTGGESYFTDKTEAYKHAAIIQNTLGHRYRIEFRAELAEIPAVEGQQIEAVDSFQGSPSEFKSQLSQELKPFNTDLWDLTIETKTKKKLTPEQQQQLNGTFNKITTQSLLEHISEDEEFDAELDSQTDELILTLMYFPPAARTEIWTITPHKEQKTEAPEAEEPEAEKPAPPEVPAQTIGGYLINELKAQKSPSYADLIATLGGIPHNWDEICAAVKEAGINLTASEAPASLEDLTEIEKKVVLLSSGKSLADVEAAEDIVAESSVLFSLKKLDGSYVPFSVNSSSYDELKNRIVDHLMEVGEGVNSREYYSSQPLSDLAELLGAQVLVHANPVVPMGASLELDAEEELNVQIEAEGEGLTTQEAESVKNLPPNKKAVKDKYGNFQVLDVAVKPQEAGMAGSLSQADVTAEKPGLWENIRRKRERGEKPAKPGQEGYPSKQSWENLTSAKVEATNMPTDSPEYAEGEMVLRDAAAIGKHVTELESLLTPSTKLEPFLVTKVNEAKKALNMVTDFLNPGLGCETPMIASQVEAAEGELRSVRVTFDDGNVVNTNIAAGVTDEEIKAYYAVGKEFNLGSGENDRIAKVTKVDILAGSDVEAALKPKMTEEKDQTDYKKSGPIPAIKVKRGKKTTKMWPKLDKEFRDGKSEVTNDNEVDLGKSTK